MNPWALRKRTYAQILPPVLSYWWRPYVAPWSDTSSAHRARQFDNGRAMRALPQFAQIGSILLDRRPFAPGTNKRSLPAAGVGVAPPAHKERRDGYTGASRSRLEAAARIVWRRRGRAARERARRVRRAAAAHHQRLCVWRHLEPPGPAAGDQKPRHDRHDGGGRKAGRAARPPQRRAEERMQARRDPRDPALGRALLRNSDRQRGAPGRRRRVAGANAGIGPSRYASRG